jgi:hypothetical protein
MKKQRKHNPSWKDNTRTERQTNRRAKLNQIAKSAGYESWSKYETEVINERVKIVQNSV